MKILLLVNLFVFFVEVSLLGMDNKVLLNSVPLTATVSSSSVSQKSATQVLDFAKRTAAPLEQNAIGNFAQLVYFIRQKTTVNRDQHVQLGDHYFKMYDLPHAYAHYIRVMDWKENPPAQAQARTRIAIICSLQKKLTKREWSILKQLCLIASAQITNALLGEYYRARNEPLKAVNYFNNFVSSTRLLMSMREKLRDVFQHTDILS